jgi:hypothetical protein
MALPDAVALARFCMRNCDMAGSFGACLAGLYLIAVRPRHAGITSGTHLYFGMELAGEPVGPALS